MKMELMRNGMLAVCGLALVGIAAPATARPPFDAEEHAAMHAAVFAEADADQNGGLSLTEFVAFKDLLEERRLEAHFDRGDADADGLLTLDELADAHGRRRGRHR